LKERGGQSFLGVEGEREGRNDQLQGRKKMENGRVPVAVLFVGKKGKDACDLLPVKAT